MKFWLAFPLFALAQASCYDYEYYDPDTGSSMGAAPCPKPTTATGGQPLVPQPLAQPFQPNPTFSLQSAPIPAFNNLPLANQVYASAPVTQVFATSPIASSMYTAPFATSIYTPPAQAAVFAAPATSVYNVPAVASAVYGPSISAINFPATTVAQSVITQARPVQVTQARPVQVTQARPVQVTQARPVQASQGSQGVTSAQRAKLEYYKNLGERQQRQHKQNAREVQDASQELQRSSLFNRVIAGSGNAAPWYPAVRLGSQKKVSEAYKSEKRIANKNAEDAYQRFQEDPSRLNLLVSKYQDKNADLRDAAYQYNVVNSATFGQRIATGSPFGGLGSLGGGTFGGLTQIITQKKQSEDLQDIQKDMQRIARQIQSEAKNVVQQKQSGVQSAPAQQGSVAQRMMAINNYGPQRG